MKKKIIFGIIFGSILLILIALFFIGKNNPSTNSTGILDNSIGETTTIIHKDFRTIMNANWEELEGTNLGYLFYTYFPAEEDSQSADLEFIFISVGYIGETNYTLEELLIAGIENSKTTMPDLILTSTIDREGENFIGKEIEFTGTSEGVMRNFVQFFCLEYGNIYSITYSCPLNNCNYYAIYNQAVNSFEPVQSKN